MSRQRVIVDTNIILEAFRTSCWKAICERYAVETVEECVEEALAGDLTDPRRIQVDRAELTSGLAALHAVSKYEVASLALADPACQALDDGELHLLAWAHANKVLVKVLVLISTADKAAIVATGRLGGLDSLVSLEQLAQAAGAARGQIERLARHYRKDWLDELKTRIRLGVIP
jgi:hypothetical protein